MSSKTAADNLSLNDLQSLQWQHRIVVVFSQDKRQYETVVEQLQTQQNEVDDRDIIWFVNTDEQLLSNRKDLIGAGLKNNLQQYDNRKNQAELLAVLIGKDGGVKARQNQWNIDSLFALIDTMPMRQREMLK